MVMDEQLIIKGCKNRLDANASLSGVAMDVFEFVDDNVSKRQKYGHIYQVTKEERISFRCAESSQKSSLGSLLPRLFSQKSSQKSCVELKGGSESVQATFLTDDLSRRSMMESMVDRGLRLKHDGILKTLLCAESVQLSKIVIGFTQFDVKLDEYLNGVQKQLDEGRMVRSEYLHDDVKEMISCGWMAVEEIWRMGYTADNLDQATSYVMVGTKMKILPYFIRTRHPGEVDKMMLKNQFADMLMAHFVPLWLEPELDDLISLMKNPNACMKDILGHPVLSRPPRRQLLYRIGCSTRFNHRQSQILGRLVTVDPDWQAIAAHIDDVLADLISTRKFSNDVHGALHFGRIVSSHYLKDLKEKKGSSGTVSSDTIDKLLKRCLVGVLSKRFNLNFDSDFIAAS